MKKVLPIFGMVLAFALVSCAPITGPETGETPPDPNAAATVVIPLPNAATRGLSITEAQTHAEYYEVFLTRTSPSAASYSGSASKEARSITLENIPVGTYDIVLIATDKDPDGYGGSPLLLASSYVREQSIVTGSNTITMTMASMYVNVEVSKTVPVSSSYTVKLTVSTQNPLLAFEQGLNIRVNGTEISSNGWWTFADKDGGTQYGYDINLTAPNQVRSEDITIRGGFFIKLDGSDRYFNFADSDHTTLGKYFSIPIDFVSAGTLPDVAINIVWPGTETPPPARPTPVSITITGMPSQQNYIEISLRNLADTYGVPIASGYGNTSGNQVTITLTEYTNGGGREHVFSTAGTYNIEIQVGGPPLSLNGKTLTTGNNVIPYTEFSAWTP